MLESGEYFLSAEQKAARAAAAQAARQAARTEERQRQREAAFQAPTEGGRAAGSGGGAQQAAAAAPPGQQTAASLAEGLKAKLKGGQGRGGGSGFVTREAVCDRRGCVHALPAHKRTAFAACSPLTIRPPVAARRQQEGGRSGKRPRRRHVPGARHSGGSRWRQQGRQTQEEAEIGRGQRRRGSGWQDGEEEEEEGNVIGNQHLFVSIGRRQATGSPLLRMCKL